jgi:hypothetical protein
VIKYARAQAVDLRLMGSGLLRWSRALAFSLVGGALVVSGFAATAAGAATSGADTAIARTGVFVATDLPAGFQSTPASTKSHADNIKAARGVDGCGPYVTLQKLVSSLPQAKSVRFEDDARSIGNEVDVFASDRAGTAALALYAKPSIVGCLENLFEKQARQDPSLRDSLDDVVVTLERQDIAGLGDDSVVYEGAIELTGTDGSTSTVGIGSAAVQVGRAVNVVTYTTNGADLTEVLAPAIDASVARLRGALARSAP